MSQSLTTNEVAALLGVTPGRVRQLVRSGQLKAEKKGRDLLIDPKSAQAAKSRKTKPGPAKAE